MLLNHTLVRLSLLQHPNHSTEEAIAALIAHVTYPSNNAGRRAGIPQPPSAAGYPAGMPPVAYGADPKQGAAGSLPAGPGDGPRYGRRAGPGKPVFTAALHASQAGEASREEAQWLSAVVQSCEYAMNLACRAWRHVSHSQPSSGSPSCWAGSTTLSIGQASRTAAAYTGPGCSRAPPRPYPHCTAAAAAANCCSVR
jgi:hypothetical protein